MRGALLGGFVACVTSVSAPADDYWGYSYGSVDATAVGTGPTR